MTRTKHNGWVSCLGVNSFIAGAGVAIFLHTQNVYAVRGQVSVGAGFEYSDNATLVEQNQESDLTRLALLGFSLTEQGSNVAADLQGLVERKDYQENFYADDTLLTLRGNLDWTVLENRLNWIAQDYYTQGTSNTRAPDTPNNQVDTNVFSTGPDFRFRLNSVDSGELGLRWSDYYYQDTTPDNTRESGYARWIHSLARGGELSLNANSESTHFDVESDDFTRNELFTTYEIPHGRSLFGVDAGVSFIDRNSAEDVDGFLGRVRWTRELGTETFFDLNAYTQYTDTGTNLLNSGAAGRGINIYSEQLSADIFYDKRIEASYRKGYAGHSTGLTVYARDEDYETSSNLDRTSYGGMLVADRNLMPRVRGDAYLTYRHTKYLSDDEIQKDFIFGLGLDYRITRKVTLAIDLTRDSRDSTTTGNGYDENRALLTLYYGMNPYSYR